MARKVNEEEYAVRRNEILDVAQRLVYTIGYEQMAIQDMLNALQISKGAFYHYFDSKQDLLDALIERLIDEAEKIMLPIVQDPQASALEKFDRYFNTLARWKTSQKSFLIALLRVWYEDNNAIVRQKILAAGIKRVTPLLTAIIIQGEREGSFKVVYPDRMSQVLFSIMMGLSDSVAEIILRHEPGVEDGQRLENIVAAYVEAMERVLGASPGSLQLFDMNMLKEWLVVDVVEAPPAAR